jgi:dipeptidase E
MRGPIILTSAGFKIPVIAAEIVKRLPRPPQEIKLAHIVTAANVAPDTAYLDIDKKAMMDLGFQVTDFSLEDQTETTLHNTLKDYDLIYVQGGNPFYLLHHIRQSGFAHVIDKLLDEGKWYIGISAGSYVCCPTIEMATWKREVDETYGLNLNNLTAMNLVPFLVTVHYNREKYREKLAKHLSHVHYPVKILTDEQALFVEGKTVTLIGKGPEVTREEIVA